MFGGYITYSVSCYITCHMHCIVLLHNKGGTVRNIKCVYYITYLNLSDEKKTDCQAAR